MRNSIVIVFALLAGCATAPQGHYLTCPTQSQCTRQAEQACPKGYNVLAAGEAQKPTRLQSLAVSCK